MQRQRAVFYAYDDHAPILAPLQGAPHIKQHTQGKPWASMFSSPFGAQIPSANLNAFCTLLSLFLWFALALAFGRLWWWGVRFGGMTWLLMMLRWPGCRIRMALMRRRIRGMIGPSYFACWGGPLLVRRVLMGGGLDCSSRSFVLSRASLSRVPPVLRRGNLSRWCLVLRRVRLSRGFVVLRRVRLRCRFLAVRRGNLISSRCPFLVSGD
jgi:hypothetical protein